MAALRFVPVVGRDWSCPEHRCFKKQAYMPVIAGYPSTPVCERHAELMVERWVEFGGERAVLPVEKLREKRRRFLQGKVLVKEARARVV